MPRIRTQKTNFTAGEISPDLLGRSDLRAYDNGAARLKNVFINPTGGVRRRPGLRYIDRVAGEGRLIAFEFNTEQVYLLVLTHRALAVYRDDVRVATLGTPWSGAQLRQLVWVQSADTLLVTHPDVEPQKITRTSHAAWTITPWSYASEDSTSDGATVGRIHQPHFKFAGDDITLTPGGLSGRITLTASADVFVPRHKGVRMRLINREVEITAVSSPTTAKAVVIETLSGTAATKDWEEQAFSPVRGWPVSLCFHQDRLVIGGSRDIPNKLWLSKSSDLYNFDTGEGLDDESIDFAILSDQVNAVRAVFSGRHLQVFTSGAEWMVTGDPLTPVNIQLNRQTRIGSPVDRAIPPRDVDGATLFIPRDGTGLREFLFADVEQAYQAGDLAILARHLIRKPVDQDYDTANRLLYVVMADGTISTVTIFRSEKVTAWSTLETRGYFRSVAVVDRDTCVLVERGGDWLLEKFDPGLNTDSALSGKAGAAKTRWSGLGHLENETLTILSNGAAHGPETVKRGAIRLDAPATSVEAGLGFAHVIQPMPPVVPLQGGAGQGTRLRPVSHTFRVQDTACLRLDTGRGPVDVPFKRLGAEVLDHAPQPFSGDKTVRALGWRGPGPEPLWRIEHDAPLPFTLLSVASEISVNG